MPMGGIVTFSTSRVRDQDGVRRLEFAVTGSVQTWPNWLAISFDHLKEADSARQRLAVAVGDDAGEANALVAEYQASLQAISSSVFALDALYGVISAMITVPEADKASRIERKAGRAVWVADAVVRASARMPNDVAKILTKRIHCAYQARDLAVHPPHIQEPYAVHPLLQNTKVPQRWLDYNLETSRELSTWITEALSWVIDHPKPSNTALTEWAARASKILHRIVDPLSNVNATPELGLQRSA